MLFAESHLLKACARGDVDFLRGFHEEGGNFAVVSELGWGPLHYAIRSDSFECVYFLVSNELADIRVKAFGHTCMDLAIDHDVSCYIIRFLLENDHNFYFMKYYLSYDPLSKSIRQSFVTQSTEIFETIVDTLKNMDYTALNIFLDGSLGILRFETAAQESISMKIFEKLMSVEYNENNFIVYTTRNMLSNRRWAKECLCKLAVEKWYLVERNEHRDLVRLLIENRDCGIDYYHMLILYSNAFFDHAFKLRSNLRDFLKINLDKIYRDIIDQYLNIAWRSIDATNIQEDFFRFFFPEPIDKKITSIEWLHVTKIGENVQINSTAADECREKFIKIWEGDVAVIRQFLHAMMPFSVDISGDFYLSLIRESINVTKNGLNAAANYAISGTELHDIQRQRANLEKLLCELDDDEELANFCVDQKYRVKSSLQSLCRTQIRRSLLSANANKKHSELVNNIRSDLGLPNTPRGRKIKRFLMFNYSDYDF